jgi:hypothetical protein
MSINDKPETARQRAARIWRNHQIQQSIINEPEPIVTIPEAQLNEIEARFRKEIREALTSHNKNKSLLQYLILKLKQRKGKDGVLS